MREKQRELAPRSQKRTPSAKLGADLETKLPVGEEQLRRNSQAGDTPGSKGRKTLSGRDGGMAALPSDPPETVKRTPWTVMPALAAIFDVLGTAIAQKALTERSTDELIDQIDAGRFMAEIAQFWNVSRTELNKWVALDARRSARAKSARRDQAELWDLVALQVLLHAPSDRVEIMRAEKIAQHCRWRAEALCRDDYGRTRKHQVDEPSAREMTTRELEIIAREEVTPGYS